VLGIADAADAAPTTQAEAVGKELEAALKTASEQWESIKKMDLSKLNELLEKEKAGKIDPERKSGDVPSSDVDGDDEP